MTLICDTPDARDLDHSPVDLVAEEMEVVSEGRGGYGGVRELWKLRCLLPTDTTAREHQQLPEDLGPGGPRTHPAMVAHRGCMLHTLGHMLLLLRSACAHVCFMEGVCVDTRVVKKNSDFIIFHHAELDEVIRKSQVSF